MDLRSDEIGGVAAETAADLPGGNALGYYLSRKLQEWKDDRKPYEQKLADFYADYMRIPRQDDTKGTGQAKSKKAKSLFIGSTRNKVRAARAKVLDSLFGTSNRLPFDTEPVDQRLAPLADAVEEILSQQLRDGGFELALKQGVSALGKYGTGVIAGPFVRDKKHSVVEVQEESEWEMPVPTEREVSYPEPYFELMHTMDVYPDPDAKDEIRAGGLFWVDPVRKDEIRGWADDPRYHGIDVVLQIADTIRKSEGSKLAEELRGIRQFYHTDGRIEVARYFGFVPKRLMPEDAATDDDEPIELESEELDTDDRAHEEAESPGLEATEGGDEGEDADDDGEVEVIAIVIGGILVNVTASPWKRRPIYRAVWEDNEHEFWGTGIAENNAPHQKVVNAAFRLFVESKGMALLPPMSIDKSAYEPGEDFRLAPGKVFRFKPSATPDERKAAFVIHTIPDVSEGWQSLIDMSERFSDDDTSVSKYTQGNDARHLNDTASGISMIMSASSLPLKEVMKNIDQMWVLPVIDALIEWDLKYLDVETVRMLHGDETAAKWEAVKAYGKSNFFKWKATGASNMMAREVLIQKLQGFLSTVASNPSLGQLTDMAELMRQIWDAMDVGRESPIRTDEELQALAEQAQAAIDAKTQGMTPEGAPLG